MQKLLKTRQVEAIDHEATGAEMRTKREAAGLSLRQMGERLHVSAAFLSDLERGRRAWSEKRCQQYVEAIAQG